MRAYKELTALGVAIHSTSEGGQVPEFVYNVLASMSQEESRQIGERVQAVLGHATGNGWHVVGGCAGQQRRGRCGATATGTAPPREQGRPP